MAGAISKILIGAVLIVASVWYVLQTNNPFLEGRSNLDDFVAILNGGIPSLVFLIGLFVVWLELDELRIEREMSGKKKK